MTVNLQFDFVVDKENNKLTVKREFAAGRQLVWDCHTKSELLDKWFAPKPFTVRTKSMNFIEGGSWLYAMIDPAGPEHWGRMDYEKINPINGYSCLDGFCNEKGELNPELPRAKWIATFKDKGANTLVETVVTYNSLNDLEVVIQMGMKEGLTMTLDNLDELLLTLKK